jgi:hypothetical protein
MQDYWNNPPEEPEIPECCELEMIVDDDGNCKCSACGATIEAQPDIEPPDEPSEPWPPENKEPPESENCPHGKKWGDCGACDHEGDLAFDAARERRLFRA